MVKQILKILFVTTAVREILSPASAITNEALLKERLITPNVYEILNRKGASTSEERFNAIREACATQELAPVDCRPIIKHRSQ